MKKGESKNLTTKCVKSVAHIGLLTKVQKFFSLIDTHKLICGLTILYFPFYFNQEDINLKISFVLL